MILIRIRQTIPQHRFVASQAMAVPDTVILFAGTPTTATPVFSAQEFLMEIQCFLVIVLEHAMGNPHPAILV